ncbi:MAG TPA: hypothetical protein VF062_17105 [Candidatus Limnocylindrales bacterium]
MSDTIPEELADAVRRAAAAAPATIADLGGLRQRYRRRRRRRVAATAGLTAAVVGAVATTAPLLARGRSATDGGQTSAPVATSQSAPPISVPPSQRLLLARNGFLQPSSPSNSVGEVMPDGTVVFRPLSEVDIADRVVALPDGRLVVLGTVDLTPGVIEQPDGPYNPAVGIMLVRQRDDGSVELSRNIRVMGEHVELLGATDRVAYLLRPAGLAAHDLATGDERLVMPTGKLPPGPPTGRAVDVAGDRIALADAACRVHLFALGTGTPVTTIGPPPGCTAPGEVRLSPDGRLAAFSYSIGSMEERELIQTRLAVLDVATGATKLDMLVFESMWNISLGQGASNFSAHPYHLQGMAWSTPRSLRLAIAYNDTFSVRPVTVP